MNRPLFTLSFLLLLPLLSSCDLLQRSFEYRDTVEEATEAVLAEDYDKVFSLMALEHSAFAEVEPAELKTSIDYLRTLILDKYGPDLEYTFMTAEKRFSTQEGAGTPEGMTYVQVQVDNGEEYGVIEALVEDSSRKLLSLQLLQFHQPVPSLGTFWLFGLLPLLVVLFNIYVILRIRRSDRPRKWVKYLAVLLFNVPSLVYTASGALSIQPLMFQVFLGVGLSFTGYANMAWTVGLPLGGLYWWWRLRTQPTLPQTNIAPPSEGETLDLP